MNPPEYNDLVDPFNLTKSVSPLPSTPVASQSHEPDEISCMEQSMVSLEPHPPKIPVKKVDSINQRRPRSRERRPRDLRWPRVFRRPFYAHVSAEKRPLEGKSLPLFKRRPKVCITPVIRLVSRRSELSMAEPPEARQILQPMQIPDSHVPEPPVPIPEPHVPIPEPPVPIPEPPVQISSVPEPMQIPDSHVPEPPVQIPEPPVQISFVPELMQIPELETLEPTIKDAASFDQFMSFVFGEELEPPAHTQELQLFHTVPSIFMVISSHSWMNFKGSWLWSPWT
ncbi:hypothetical protein TNCV_1872151 [Trichonephila clavipes]|nr:hypothetical protein TNCV_1872151 [Trichonephila clavipes]